MGREWVQPPEDVEPEPQPELHVELARLDAFIRAYQAMTSDPERRRALNYLRDRFPGPTVYRDRPGGDIIK